MSEIQNLFKELPVDQIAKQAGVSPTEASQAIQAVLPALVGGMEANAKDPAGAASLERALGAHQHAFSNRVQGQDIDVQDGEKIVRHVFGQNEDQVVNALAAKGGGGGMSDIIKKILPIVAPIVIAWLANKYFGGQNADASTAGTKPGPQGEGSGFDLGGLLGGLFGGGSGSSGSSGGGFGLDDLLGGLLGGGRR